MKIADLARRFSLAAAALLIAFGLTHSVQAWDFQGHMALGLATFDELKRTSPDTLRAVLRLAESLPARDKLDAALVGVTGEQRDRLVFAYLSRWPDDIRGTSRDRPKEHYRLHALTKVSWIPPVLVGDARDGYEQNMFLLKTYAAPVEERAAALAWIFHIVEDMHQPLHAGTWVSVSYPRSDESGTRCFVRTSSDGEPDSLHNFWDAAADHPGELLPATEQTAADIEAIDVTKLTELNADPADFKVWETESANLARSAVYQNGELKRSPKPEDAPVLSPDYIESARALAQRRMAIAAHRLAQILIRAMQP
jgi:hypothetical protein